MLIQCRDLDAFEKDIIVETIPPSKSEIVKHDVLMRLMTQLKISHTLPGYKIHQLAHHSALSERQLFRFFKLNLNSTPSNFVRRYRLEKSLTYLGDGISLGDISFHVGFSSQSYFCRCFKDCFGETPKNIYLNNWQNFNKESEEKLLN